MKFIISIFFVLFASSSAYSIVLDGVSRMQETGHYAQGRTMMLTDSVHFNKVQIEVFEKSALIHTTTKQEFLFTGESKITEEINKHYIITFSATDVHKNECLFVVYYHKITKMYIIVVSYPKTYSKFYMHKN